MGHKNLKIVSPKDDINDKIKEVLNHINRLLDEEEVKSQKKYYVDLEGTDITYLRAISKVANIEQSYLQSTENVEKRLRKISMNGFTSYNYTIHRTNPNGKVVKISDKSISRKMYEELLDFQDNNKGTIIKERFYFPYKDKYFTLDIMDGYGLLEVNITDEKEIDLPPFINVIEDVTTKEEYLNRNLASKNNKQYIKK